MENLTIATLKSESGQLNIDWFIYKLRLVNATTNPTDFVIDFQEMVEVLGYRKDNLKRVLLSSELEENVDYQISFLISEERKRIDKNNSKNDENNTETVNNSTLEIKCLKHNPNPSETIKLTVFAAKVLALLTKSKNGAEFRKYFINAEQQLHKIQSQSVEDSQQYKSLKAEFEDYKVKQEKLIKSLLARIDTLESKVRASEMTTKISDTEAYDYDLYVLWLITGIKDYYYIIRTLKERYKYEDDYITRKPDKKNDLYPYGNLKYMLNAKAALNILLNYRSRLGVSKANIPEDYQFLIAEALGENINSRELRSR